MSRKTIVQISTALTVIFLGVAKNLGIDINQVEFTKTAGAVLVPFLIWVTGRKNTDKLLTMDRFKSTFSAKWLSKDFLTVLLGAIASIANATLGINLPEWIIPSVVTALMGAFLKKEADAAKATTPGK